MKKLTRSASVVAATAVAALGAVLPVAADEPVSFTVSGKQRQIIGSTNGEITPEQLVKAMRDGAVQLKWIPKGSVLYLACNAPFLENLPDKEAAIAELKGEGVKVETQSIPGGTVQYLACNAPFMKDE